MALEGIPLSWDVLSIFGTALITGAGAAWKLSQTICKHRLEDLKCELQIKDNKCLALSNDLDNGLRENRFLGDEIAKARELIKLLQDDLSRARPGELRSIDELRSRLKGLEALRHALTTDQEVWKLRGDQPPHNFAARMSASRTKIITVINYKGGVGKTTLVAGLSAYLAQRNKRVLIIDFDYQGSLTRTLLLGSSLQLGNMIQADAVIGGEVDGRSFIELARDLGATLRNARFITSGHTFDRAEFRVMLKWLIGDTADDVRFRLASLVLSDEVQREFDYVIVDAPPRASTGALNAICASHALIVPTVLDSLSVDGAASFLARANASFRPLNPGLEFAGIVGTLTEAAALTAPEINALEEARRALRHWGGRSHLFASRIRHFRAISQAAGNGIAYLRDRGVRQAFDALGDELLRELHEDRPAPRDAPGHSPPPRPQRGAPESGIAPAL